MALAGVIPVDKPEGPTSHDMVALARRALGERRIGHTGTLDPFASGLLLLCVGRATRLSEFLTGLDKSYEAVARFGNTGNDLAPLQYESYALVATGPATGTSHSTDMGGGIVADPYAIAA